MQSGIFYGQKFTQQDPISNKKIGKTKRPFQVGPVDKLKKNDLQYGIIIISQKI